MKSTRYYSNKQEKAIAKNIGGRKVANSGATRFNKGDVQTDDWLIEAKTKTSASKSMTIQKEWLIKNKEEAFAMGKMHNALCFDFGDGDRYYVIGEKEFKQLIGNNSL